MTQISSFLKFPTHDNFELCHCFFYSLSDPVDPQYIATVLDSVVSVFYANLDSTIITKKPVLVFNSLFKNPPSDTPEILQTNNVSLIFLHTHYSYWCQYSYQFAHELCHHVIDTKWPPICDRFGWLEETLCELASLLTLYKMNIVWQTHTTYQNMLPFNSLKEYADNESTKVCKYTNTFSEWLSNNLEKFYNNRSDRVMNRTVAIKLLPLFKKYPILWRTIHFLKDIPVTDDMTLCQYLFAWKERMPKDLHFYFENIIELLNCN